MISNTSRPKNPTVGEYWVDIPTGQLYMFTGATWLKASIGNNALELDYLIKIHPGLAELKEEVDAAQEKFDAYLALVKENQ